MNLSEIIAGDLAAGLRGNKVLGIDIGSRTGKAVLIHDDQLYTALTPTGIDMQDTADELLNEILDKSELQRSQIDYIVGTGYGRVALRFDDIPSQIVTEISCHAMGAHYLNPGVRTIIDIGGQDSKAIRVDPDTGKVVAFVMNDKCAAGTGRFLERVANLLDLSIDELGAEAVKAVSPTHITSQCVVFAESEAISLRARGESKEDITAGIHLATARRVRNLLKRLGFEPDLVFSGGVSNNIGMKKALEELLEAPITEVKLDTIYAGALGAAIHARDFLESGKSGKAGEKEDLRLDLSGLEKRIREREDLLIHSQETKKSRVFVHLHSS
jgi:CoA-substrate-specific enzyme activase, putative